MMTAQEMEQEMDWQKAIITVLEDKGEPLQESH